MTDTEGEERRLADDIQLAMRSDAAASAVCHALGGARLPWPQLERAFQEWREHHEEGAYADGCAQEVCRAIAYHISHGGRAPKAAAEEYNQWALIRRDMAARVHAVFYPEA